MSDTRRDVILNTIGFGLLIVCFAVALGRIAWLRAARASAQDGQPVVTLRIGHWQLESGLREAFDAIGREFERLNPGVRVEQIPVPERIFPNWLITQLVGGTAPDLIALGYGLTEERLARFFLPISDLADRPNPWNAGTDLEGVPLRETFLDGMDGGYFPALLEFYGVPLAVHTIRMYYNLDLLREITGEEKLPATFAELLELAKKAEDFSRRTGRPVIPIAGSKYNSPILMGRLFVSQTEGLGERLAYDFLANRPSQTFIAEGLAAGLWSVDSAEVRAGLSLLRAAGRHMQAGFMQLMRDDAMFYFVQGKALMITTGSWDVKSVTTQVPFRLGVGRIPYPLPGEPLAPYSLGPIADPSNLASSAFGLTRSSKHPELAKSLLLFLASRRGNQIFADHSEWPPSVLGVKPSKLAEPFAPFLQGRLGGFGLDFSGPDARREVNIAINRLVSPQGSVEAFLDALRPGYLSAVRADFQRLSRSSVSAAQRFDTTMGALAWMVGKDERGAAAAARKLEELLQTQNGADYFSRRVAQALQALEEAR